MRFLSIFLALFLFSGIALAQEEPGPQPEQPAEVIQTYAPLICMKPTAYETFKSDEKLTQRFFTGLNARKMDDVQLTVTLMMTDKLWFGKWYVVRFVPKAMYPYCILAVGEIGSSGIPQVKDLVKHLAIDPNL